ncbi:alpha/beta hydrolase [Rhizobiaceae bacterium n13]|uniref:Alpha/beta hydrolase n=1 Tax=Ferirhizobium litorale TaxID=2927786 RepID=A0AAE3U3K6_9HYPH|nr:alpha/beta hydrolase [Fererhizobium litorale]MDI7862228.1 alpha/beta hydrolase [Fererhizobium litorale]MDI7922498.1 alpha/beta hydrolase [Fererhizobium litorale]
MRIARLAVAAVLVATLSGCGGRHIGVMAPTNATQLPAGVSEVNLMVATTRAPDEDRSVLFSGERGDDLKLDAVTVSIPPDGDREAGHVQWPKRLPADPLRDFTTVSVKPIATDTERQAWIRDNLPKNRRVMIFVHGFNNRYEDAVYRFAQIIHDSNAEVAPVVFTWPSRASIFDYNYDKESTNYSRDALEELLRRVAANPQAGEITVMAHSMGTWLTVEALRQMAIRDGHLPAKIENVILASPDLDVDVFGKQIAALGEKKPNITLFVSQDDRALKLSRRISGNVDRLGQVDPTQEPYSTQFENAGITVLDLTKLKSGDRLNHGKFAESPEVVQLIGQRLVEGQAVSEHNIGLGDAMGAVALGAAQTVGTAAGVAVSAPIAVFDPNTRRNYDSQLRRLGQSMENTVGSVGDTVTTVGGNVGDAPVASPDGKPPCSSSRC